jgi:hypothetical protein
MPKKYNKDTGKPINKGYLECDLPKYLQKDIEAFVKGEAEESSLMDCLWGELYGSINSAMTDNRISKEQATYLRTKYLFESQEEDDC